jgi:hypothetical protein
MAGSGLVDAKMLVELAQAPQHERLPIARLAIVADTDALSHGGSPDSACQHHRTLGTLDGITEADAAGAPVAEPRRLQVGLRLTTVYSIVHAAELGEEA